MANTTKIYENQYDVVYALNSDLNGMFSVPKNLENNIKVFMMFVNNPQNESDRNGVVDKLLRISKNVNTGNNNSLSIVVFFNNDILLDNSVSSYERSISKIKNLVNEIYNNLLAEGIYTKSNFIKVVELLYEDDRYINLINYLCSNNPKKFHANRYQTIMSNSSLNENVSTNNLDSSSTSNNLNSLKEFTISSGFNNNFSSQQPIVQPISETLSIGSYVPYYDDTSGSGGPSNNINNNKVLVKKLPKNAAFIKLPTVLLILIISLVIGIGFGIYLLK